MQLLFEYQELWTVVLEGIDGNSEGSEDEKSEIEAEEALQSQAECRFRKQDFQANVVEDGDCLETLLLACNMAEDGAKNKWFMDSGCSNHMCGEKEMFTQLDESFTSSVKFGNDTTVPVMGKGKISITLKDSDSLPCFSSLICDETWLWYMRFGHVNFGSLKQLASRKMVSGLPSINPPDRVCETCVLGKKHRDLFPIGKAWRASCWDWSSGKGSSSDVNIDLEEIVQEEVTPVTPPPDVTPYPAESSSRPQRQQVLLTRLQDCVMSNDNYPTDEKLVNFTLFVDCDPITYEDAARDDCWIKAMNEEIGAIEKNNTWELTDLPSGK
ncbi:hypothetical protein EZV62_024941 [Acer yangbiense]|uniref:Uncharacterized protein n=1 Tax=Acer yangbiense TaxID=1000413 RepID=A0A5C7GYC2_9ROSI|nr:hypothetical protein EZV62_024941 [Acer yangbiense]